MSPKKLHWHEWDFRAVPENEWAACLAYELARESDAEIGRAHV